MPDARLFDCAFYLKLNGSIKLTEINRFPEKIKLAEMRYFSEKSNTP